VAQHLKHRSVPGALGAWPGREDLPFLLFTKKTVHTIYMTRKVTYNNVLCTGDLSGYIHGVPAYEYRI
jgi:hypothetical protein